MYYISSFLLAISLVANPISSLWQTNNQAVVGQWNSCMAIGPSHSWIQAQQDTSLCHISDGSSEINIQQQWRSHTAPTAQNLKSILLWSCISENNPKLRNLNHLFIHGTPSRNTCGPHWKNKGWKIIWKMTAVHISWRITTTWLHFYS